MTLPDGIRQQLEEAIDESFEQYRIAADETPQGDLDPPEFFAAQAACEVFESWLERLGTVVKPGGGVFRVIVYRDLEFYPEVGAEVVRLRNPKDEA